MRLTDWGRLYGLNQISTRRTYNEGRLPPDLEVEKVGGILYVKVLEDKQLSTGGYARVSSSYRKHLLEGQSSRLWKYAGENGIVMDRVVEEVASGLNDRWKKLPSLLSDPDLDWLVMEHRYRLASVGVSTFGATGWRACMFAGLGSLTNMQGLAAANSGICIPSGDAFSDWLAAVHDKPGIDGLTACK